MAEPLVSAGAIVEQTYPCIVVVPQEPAVPPVVPALPAVPVPALPPVVPPVPAVPPVVPALPAVPPVVPPVPPAAVVLVVVWGLPSQPIAATATARRPIDADRPNQEGASALIRSST